MDYFVGLDVSLGSCALCIAMGIILIRPFRNYREFRVFLSARNMRERALMLSGRWRHGAWRCGAAKPLYNGKTCRDFDRRVRGDIKTQKRTLTVKT